jgi:hypothetical protein
MPFLFWLPVILMGGMFMVVTGETSDAAGTLLTPSSDDLAC